MYCGTGGTLAHGRRGWTGRMGKGTWSVSGRGDWSRKRAIHGSSHGCGCGQGLQGPVIGGQGAHGCWVSGPRRIAGGAGRHGAAFPSGRLGEVFTFGMQGSHRYWTHGSLCSFSPTRQWTIRKHGLQGSPNMHFSLSTALLQGGSDAVEQVWTPGRKTSRFRVCLIRRVSGTMLRARKPGQTGFRSTPKHLQKCIFNC